MKQLFFYSTSGSAAIHKALGLGGSYCTWSAGDHMKDLTIGVLELRDWHDPEEYIDKMEAEGIEWLPNHLVNPIQVIDPKHAMALAVHGVKPEHTTAQAMMAISDSAGVFPPFKPRRF